MAAQPVAKPWGSFVRNGEREGALPLLTAKIRPRYFKSPKLEISSNTIRGGGVYPNVAQAGAETARAIRLVSQMELNSRSEVVYSRNIMKNIGHSAVVFGMCAGAVCVASANAQSTQPPPSNSYVTAPNSYEQPVSPAHGLYLGADVGGLLTSDVRVKNFLGSVSPGTKVDLDPGVRVGFRAGYHFTDWFAVEGETGVMANNIHSITGANIDGNATLANVPFLINARFELPHGNCPITPYFGGGAGGSATVLSFDRHIDFNDADLHGSDSDVVFAYQAFGGLRYAITDKIGLGVEYHFICTTGSSWTADGFGPNKISFAGTRSHAITAAFNYRF